MKNNISIIASSIFVVIVVLSTFSCKKTDETIPDLKLYKDSVDTIFLNEKLVDPGALSIDNFDGDISSLISSDYLTVINKDSTGKYIVTYKIVDKAGNINLKKRSVYVVNQAFPWQGNYNAVDTLFNLPIAVSSDTFRKTYSVKVVASWKENRVLWIKGYGQYSTTGYPSINLTANVLDSSGTLKKANVPLVNIKNLTYGVATAACATSSHKIKSLYDFYLYNVGTKTIQIEYEDEIYEPIDCVALKRGRLKLTYTSAL